MLQNKTPNQVGMDISDSSIKVLEVSNQGPSYRVESYAVAPLTTETVIEKNIKDMSALAQTI